MSIYVLKNRVIFDEEKNKVASPVHFDSTFLTTELITPIITGLDKLEFIFLWISINGGKTFSPYVEKGKQKMFDNSSTVYNLSGGFYYGFTKNKTKNKVNFVINYFDRNEKN